MGEFIRIRLVKYITVFVNNNVIQQLITISFIRL